MLIPPSAKLLGAGRALAGFTAAGLWLCGFGAHCGPFVVAFFVLLALMMRGSALLKSFVFTASVLTSVSVALFYPAVFGDWAGFRFEYLIVPLTQIIMPINIAVY